MQLEVFHYENRTDIEPRFVETGALLGVRIGEFAISEAGLYTIGVASGIVVAGHNRESNKGLIGHFVSPTSKKEIFGSSRTRAEEFEGVLEGLVQLGNFQSTKIWLGGAAPRQHRGADVTSRDSKHAEETVVDYMEGRGLVGNPVHTRWSGLGRVIDVELDCQQGVLSVHEYPADNRYLEKRSRSLQWISE